MDKEDIMFCLRYLGQIDLKPYHPLRKDKLVEALKDAKDVLKGEFKMKPEEEITRSIDWLKWIINPCLCPALHINQKWAVECAIQLLEEKKEEWK